MITVIFTCHNRKQKTIRCIKSLIEGNTNQQFSFVVLDDNSTDGTEGAIKTLVDNENNITILKGNGNMFWAGGMRCAIGYAKEKTDTDYYLLINDDVIFFQGSIERMLSEYVPNSALVGAMCDWEGNFTYGGVRYIRGIRYTDVKPTDDSRSCDTFNMNCVLIDRKTFDEIPNFDEHYIHSLADFDYGLSMKRRMIKIQVSSCYVGVCLKNGINGSWTDTSLSRIERLRKKENVKGAPFAPWFYFLKKNFGTKSAIIHSLSPYIRIFLKK